MHVVHLARGMNHDRLRTRLIAGSVSPAEGDMEYYARERGVEVTHLPRLGREMSPLSDLRVLYRLYRLFRRERPDVVHTHTAKAGALGRLAAALARVPVRVHTFHGHVLGGGYFSRRGTRFFLAVERLAARLTHRIVVLTEAQAREMSEELRVAPAGRFRVIPLGLELERFTAIPLVPGDSDRSLIARAMLGVDEDTWVVGIVGRLVPVKNHELLLDAVASLPEEDVRIVVVGGGEREEALRRHAEQRGIAARVHWLGWRDDLPDIYPAMDVLALTSLDEGTPVAVIEALAAGVPVVARAVGGVPDVLADGRFGRLVPEAAGSDPVAAFARALEETLEDPPNLRLRAEARRSVDARFGIGRLLREMEDLYREALEEAGVHAAGAADLPPQPASRNMDAGGKRP